MPGRQRAAATHAAELERATGAARAACGWESLPSGAAAHGMLLAVWPHLAVVCLRSRSRLASSVASASERTLRRALAINAALQRQRCTVGAQLLQHVALRVAACFAVLHVCAVAAPSSAASAEDRAHARLHAVVRSSVPCAARSSSVQDVVPKRCVTCAAWARCAVSQSVGIASASSGEADQSMGPDHARRAALGLRRTCCC